MRWVCKLFGHDWDSCIDPKCRRCDYELAEGVLGGGNVHLGWGRYGYITPVNGRRDPLDVRAELDRINSLPSWRP